MFCYFWRFVILDLLRCALFWSWLLCLILGLLVVGFDFDEVLFIWFGGAGCGFICGLLWFLRVLFKLVVNWSWFVLCLCFVCLCWVCCFGCSFVVYVVCWGLVWCCWMGKMLWAFLFVVVCLFFVCLFVLVAVCVVLFWFNMMCLVYCCCVWLCCLLYCCLWVGFGY